MSCCDGKIVMKGFALEYTALLGTALCQFVASFISYYGRFFNTGYTLVLISCAFAIPAVRSKYADRCFGIVASVFAIISSLTFFITSIICFVGIASTPLSSPKVDGYISYKPAFDNDNFSSIGGLTLTLFCVFEFIVSTILAVKHITNLCRAKRMTTMNQELPVAAYTAMSQPFVQQ